MRDIIDDPSNFNPFIPHHAQYPVRKSRRGRKRSSDNRISLLDYPRKQRFGKVVWPAQRIEGGKACTLLRRSANPHFVRLSSSSSSSLVVVVGSSGSSATTRSSSARGPLPPPPSDPVSPPQASVKARLRPEQPWRARTEPSHGAVPRLRTIDSHGNEPRSRSRVGGGGEVEEVGLAKGGGRVVGWSRDGAHRAGSPGKGSAKNGHGPDRALHPLRVSIEIRFPGETVS